MKASIENELRRGEYRKKEINRALNGYNSKIISYHIKDIENNMILLNELLSKFGTRRRVIFPTEPGMVEKILETRCKYKLLEADSIHLGSMLFGGHKNLISFDRKDFEKIPGINLWCKHQ